MQWEFKDDRPIYAQIIEQIKLRIVAGELAPGGKLPSVRELAAEAGVNPNTMQRALSDLEREGLLYAQRTAGRFITEDQSMIDAVKNQMAKRLAADFLDHMQRIGYRRDEVLALLEQVKEEEE